MPPARCLAVVYRQSLLGKGCVSFEFPQPAPGTVNASLSDSGRLRRACIIDHEICDAMLVEADDGTIQKLRAQLPDWVIAPEAFYSKPKPE